MKIKLIFIISTLILTFICCKTKSNNDKSKKIINEYLPSRSPLTIKNIETIAFGSCNHENDDQSYWNEISKNNPDLWIWGGDNIYADSKTMEVLKSKYDLLKINSFYQAFRNKVPIIGTWDDHDYGDNDGNKTFSMKAESKELMLEFLDVPATSDVFNHEGVYMSYTFGDVGQKIKVILLDTRSFQDVLIKNPSGKSRYIASKEGDILGTEQWNWLEQELYNNEADVHIIMSSIQFLADKHGFEKWGNFPKSKDKMISMIHYSNANNVLFLSGDRHIAEISRIVNDSIHFPLYDITSSGLTHSYSKSKEINPYRIGDLVVDKNYGVLNFNWSDSTVVINCKLKGMSGQVYVNHDFQYPLNQ
jgi:alkaline phosphatase D